MPSPLGLLPDFGRAITGRVIERYNDSLSDTKEIAFTISGRHTMYYLIKRCLRSRHSRARLKLSLVREPT